MLKKYFFFIFNHIFTFYFNFSHFDFHQTWTLLLPDSYILCKQSYSFFSLFLVSTHNAISQTHLASNSRGSSGGYIDLTISSTRGLMRLAMATISISVSGVLSCCVWAIVMPTIFSVNMWQILRIAKQWGANPLKWNDIKLSYCNIFILYLKQ